MSEKGAENLSLAFKNISNLTSLKLEFILNTIGSHGMTLLSEALGDLKNLINLRL